MHRQARVFLSSTSIRWAVSLVQIAQHHRRRETIGGKNIGHLIQAAVKHDATASNPQCHVAALASVRGVRGHNTELEETHRPRMLSPGESLLVRKGGGYVMEGMHTRM